MPNGDYGVFTPAEAAYAKPGAFETMVRGEATKKGTYLSMMDRFYAELEAQEEQFGKRLAFEKERLESEEARAGEVLDWYREQEAGRLGIEEKKLGTQRYLGRLTTTGGGREALTGGPFEPYLTTSERKRKLEEEGGVTMEWLSEQLSRMYPEGEVGF